MSIGTGKRPPPPSSKPPPPPPIGEDGSDISSHEYRERLRSKSRSRGSKNASPEPQLKKKSIDFLKAAVPANEPTPPPSAPLGSLKEGEPTKRNKVKLLQPPDGFTLMDLDNDLLKRRFKNRAERFYSPLVLLTEGLYTTSSTKFSIVEDKAQEIGLVIHIDIEEETNPDANLSQFQRLSYKSSSNSELSTSEIGRIAAKIHENSISPPAESSRRATLIRYDPKKSEDLVARLCGSYLMNYGKGTVEEAYSTLKTKLLSSRKDKFNSQVYLKLVEIHEESSKGSHSQSSNLKYIVKNNFISLSLNWIPLFIIGLLLAVYFRGALKLIYTYVL